MKVKPIILCGGYDKHIPFHTLGDALCQMAKRVILTGATAPKILDAIKQSAYYPDSPLEIEFAEDIARSVRLAAEAAEEGDIVLLSPACASFDAFKNFEERGNYFKELVMELE